MTQPDGQGADQTGNKPAMSPWRDTVFIWVVVALGGGGLWLSVADPIFGGPQLAPAALTMFAFFAAGGAAATVLIWCWPLVWHRWFHLMPAEGNNRLEAVKMAVHAAFWVLAIALVAGMVNWQWSPVTAGAAGGCLVLCRLGLDVGLQHWLGKRCASKPKEASKDSLELDDCPYPDIERSADAKN